MKKLLIGFVVLYILASIWQHSFLEPLLGIVVCVFLGSIIYGLMWLFGFSGDENGDGSMPSKLDEWLR
jgi:hypothetical protein